MKAGTSVAAAGLISKLNESLTTMLQRIGDAFERADPIEWVVYYNCQWNTVEPDYRTGSRCVNIESKVKDYTRRA